MYISYIPQTYENLIVSAQVHNDISVPDAITIECKDSNLFYIVLDALANRKKVSFSNLVKDLRIPDLQITEHQYFGAQSAIHSLYSEAIKYFGLIPQYSYFRFAYLNNIFASKGIFITDENREESYIRILETEDDILIKHLEEYLVTLTHLNQYEKLYQCFINAKEKMLVETDEKVLQVILQEAVDFFKSSQKNYVTLDDRGWFSTVKAKYEESKIGSSTNQANTTNNGIEPNGTI